MNVSLSWWVGFIAIVLALLAFDMLVSRSRKEARDWRRALGWSVFWVMIAVAFGGAIAEGWVGAFDPAVRGHRSIEFFTAYLVEESLSVDNVFVFLILFRYFKVDAAHQHRVLFWGVLGAMVMRMVMILGGIALVNRFEVVMYIFGVLLLWSAWRMAASHGETSDPAKNPILRLLRKIFPMTHGFRGASFFVRENGRLFVTPLFAVLVALESTDVLFAVDSVPAVLAVTRDPFIAYTSNIFAILGLRTLYFLLAGVLERFWLLHYGLSLLLAFIGVKMLIAKVHEITVPQSLIVIAIILAGSIAGSLLFKQPVKKQKQAP